MYCGRFAWFCPLLLLPLHLWMKSTFYYECLFGGKQSEHTEIQQKKNCEEALVGLKGMKRKRILTEGYTKHLSPMAEGSYCWIQFTCRNILSCGKKLISLLPKAAVHHTSNFRGYRFTQMKSGNRYLIFITPSLNEETCWWEMASFIPLSTKDNDWPFTRELM